METMGPTTDRTLVVKLKKFVMKILTRNARLLVEPQNTCRRNENDLHTNHRVDTKVKQTRLRTVADMREFLDGGFMSNWTFMGTQNDLLEKEPTTRHTHRKCALTEKEEKDILLLRAVVLRENLLDCHLL